MPLLPLYFFFFFFNDTATTEIYTLSLHDALPISFVIARGSTNGYKRAWVRLVDEDGQEGWGEADPSSFYGESLDTVLASFDKLASHLPRDPFDLEPADDRWQHARPRNCSARAALSPALHDCVGDTL